MNICGHEGLGKSTLARYLSRDGTAFVSLYGSYGEMRERIGECVSIVSRMGGKAAPGALVVDNCELPWGGSGLTLEPVFQAWSGGCRTTLVPSWSSCGTTHRRWRGTRSPGLRG
ncbi:hypothetical protein [Thermogymnomonas acidicola]|uniref:hypothetical protein n=1 Tax=Thermogymnomonas acidicola TaxID=399579 RepID=UPI001494963B|nr:hypothetical protein [Thermogymnomonas acidicola]